MCVCGGGGRRCSQQARQRFIILYQNMFHLPPFPVLPFFFHPTHSSIFCANFLIYYYSRFCNSNCPGFFSFFLSMVYLKTIFVCFVDYVPSPIIPNTNAGIHVKLLEIASQRYCLGISKCLFLKYVSVISNFDIA